jgi:hypothetical protein
MGGINNDVAVEKRSSHIIERLGDSHTLAKSARLGVLQDPDEDLDGERR